MNFIAFDFETANFQKHSACSVALVCVQNNQIVDQFYSLIQPETDFHWKNIQIHGIRPADVVDAPKFPEVWEKIRHYFQPNHVIVAHNAPFDNSVLKGCLAYYDLPFQPYMSLCSVQTSRRLYPHFKNHKLNTVSAELAIELHDHHNALADSQACAEIILHQVQEFGEEALKPLVKFQQLT